MSTRSQTSLYYMKVNYKTEYKTTTENSGLKKLTIPECLKNNDLSNSTIYLSHLYIYPERNQHQMRGI